MGDVSVGVTLSTVTVNVCTCADAAVVVVDRDRDRVDAVVGVGVGAVERAGRRHAGRAVRVGNALAGDRVASIAPIDVVGERLRLFGAGIERVVEARVAERGVEADRRAFVDRRGPSGRTLSVGATLLTVHLERLAYRCRRRRR